MRQLPLPGLEPFRPATTSHSSATSLAVSQEPASDSGTGQQLWLFSGPAVLLRELECAIDAGDFEAVSLVREHLQDESGPSPLTRSLERLDRFQAGIWQRPAREILDTWTLVDSRLSGQPWLRQRVQTAVLTRVLGVSPAPQVVKERPQFLVPLCDTLHRAGGAGVASARALVRDALLEGRTFDPRDFSDAALKDLLGEDREPVWLACLGAIRRIWPAPPPSDAERLDLEDRVTRPEPLDSTNCETARVFWLCLRVADSSDPSAELVHEAARQ